MIVGKVFGERIELREVHRFANRPVRLPDGLHWNMLGLLGDVLDGLAAAAQHGPLSGIGVDAWGVDYGLLDDRHRLLGPPFHYRDQRTEGLAERAFERIPRERLFAATGIQTMPINTAFQLLAEEGTAMLEVARSIALISDLVVLWLCGELANEATIASTTGLLEAGTARWSSAVISALGLPRRLFGEIVEPATRVGTLLDGHAEAAGLGDAPPVFAVASHDTASAFVAAPVRVGDTSAVLCSGTWSLLGVELEEPVLSETARAANLTNERGLDGSTRLLKNVMGLWLLQECRRAWGNELSYDELQQMASECRGPVPLFDPDAEEFLAPGDMPRRIADACRRTRQEAPDGRGATVRSVLVSLACKYRYVIERLEEVTESSLETVHVIGGGARNALLCQLTADLIGRPVLAGPVEASALGNVLVQAQGAELFASAAQTREAAVATARTTTYEPGPERERDEQTYRTFLEVTDLTTPAPA